MAAKPASPPQPAAASAPQPPSRRSRRALYVSMAAVVVLVAIVAGALAMTGHLGIGAGGSVTSSGAVTTAPDKMVAKVGGQEITRQHLDQKIADFAAQYAGHIPDKTAAPDRYKQFEEGVLDYLITYELVSQKATTLGLAVTDQDVESEMALILDTTYGGDQTKFDAAIKAQGLTLESFERIYGESLLLNKVYAEVTKGVAVASTDSMELEAKQKKFWSDWVSQQKEKTGVSYADGWAAPKDIAAPVDPSGR